MLCDASFFGATFSTVTSTSPSLNEYLPQVTANLSVSGSPRSVAYDNLNGKVYVADWGYPGNVGVVSNTTMVATVAVNGSPSTVTYDSQDGAIYEANWACSDGGTSNSSSGCSSNGSVDELSGTSVKATFPVGSAPSQIVFSPSDGLIYVADENSSSVTVISGGSIVTAIGLPGAPRSMLFDPDTGSVYVGGHSWVGIITGTNLTATAAIDGRATGMTYDPINKEVYLGVVNTTLPCFGGEVDILVGISIETSLPADCPDALSFDPMNGLIYVTEASFDPVGTGPGEVLVVNNTSEISNISVGYNPDSVVTDGAGLAFVANYGPVTFPGQGNLTVINGTEVLETLNVGIGPLAECYDPTNGNVYVANGQSSVSVVSTRPLPSTSGGGGKRLPGGPEYERYLLFAMIAGLVVLALALLWRRSRRIPPAPNLENRTEGRIVGVFEP